MKAIWIICCACLLVCCSSKKDHELIDQSVEAHEQAIDMGTNVENKLLKMKQMLQQCYEKNKQTHLDSMDRIQEDLKSWKSTITEVPGVEHDHEHHHGHDHDHNHASHDLTPEMILEIQMDLLKRANALNERSESLLKTIQDCNSSTHTPG